MSPGNWITLESVILITAPFLATKEHTRSVFSVFIGMYSVHILRHGSAEFQCRRYGTEKLQLDPA